MGPSSAASRGSLPSPLIDAMQRARVVSFDIFDTALIRATDKPVDLFMVLAHAEGIGDPVGFARARIAAEAAARRAAWEREGAVEITLPEIYSHLAAEPTLPPGCPPMTGLMARERELELRLCRRHPLIGRAYDWALGMGKRVGFLSDMYLDRELLVAMLARCGYQGYHFLLVSSEVGTTKSTGGLYRLLLQQEGIAPEEQLHVGDNPDADIRQARAQGVAAWSVEKCCDTLVRSALGRRLERGGVGPVSLKASPDEGGQAMWRSLWRGLVAARQAEKEQGFWWSLGYTHVGMLLLGFALWLNREASRTGVPKLYFLARDGHVMTAVHRLLEERGLASCGGSYLFASRRVLNVPALTAVDEAACDFLVSGTTRLPVGLFLSRVGLDAEAVLPAIRAAGFSGPEHWVRTGEEYGRLRALFRELAPVLLERAVDERRLLEAYLRQEGVFDQPHVGLVDIGWHGSLQESLTRLLALCGQERPVTGFYLGTFAAARKRVAAGAGHNGYLCEGGEPEHRLAVIRASVEVFEWLFCAPHGSVVGFRRRANGTIAPRFEAGELEQVRERSASVVQEGALQFIRDALDCFPPGVVPPLPAADLVVGVLAELLGSPSAQEARELGELPHAEGFGEVIAIRPIARPPAHPLNLVAWPRLLEGYRQAFWRKGYLRRLWGDCWWGGSPGGYASGPVIPNAD